MGHFNAENGADGIQFKHFDVVPEAKDHHYLQSNTSHKDRKCFNNVNAPVYAKIMREWRILENNLPESIYVQVYETRIDLMRAVIIGSAGTPYHDGLFFFDIVLPIDYPNQPPILHYHSHGYRVNPNLYVCGKVCISLIKTTGGSKDEKWTKGSTLLQILVSIQGLVLNHRPFFNYTNYEVHRTSTSSEWINKSIRYNDDAFILSCKTMLQSIRQPPKNFENFVFQHFRGRAASILAAIEHYRKGHALVGQFDQMNAVSCSSSSFRVSQILDAKLIEIQLQLKEAFASILSDPSKVKASATDPIKYKALASTAKEMKKGRNGKDQGRRVKSQENAKRRKKGRPNKIIRFAEKIRRKLQYKIISFAKNIWK